MELSEKGMELITSFEGLRLKAYKPVKTEKYWTIGYGHYGSDVKEGMVITKEKALALFKQDVSKFEKYVNEYVTSNINQYQFDALVSFAYNLGPANLKSSTLLKKVNANPNDKTIATEFKKWNKSAGKVLAGLTRRREKEAELYFTEIPENCPIFKCNLK